MSFGLWTRLSKPYLALRYLVSFLLKSNACYTRPEHHHPLPQPYLASGLFWGKLPFSITTPVFPLLSSVPEPFRVLTCTGCFVLPWNNYIITQRLKKSREESRCLTPKYMTIAELFILLRLRVVTRFVSSVIVRSLGIHSMLCRQLTRIEAVREPAQRWESNPRHEGYEPCNLTVCPLCDTWRIKYCFAMVAFQFAFWKLRRLLTMKG